MGDEEVQGLGPGWWLGRRSWEEEKEGRKEADSRIDWWESFLDGTGALREALKRRDGLGNLDRGRRSAQVAQGGFRISLVKGRGALQRGRKRPMREG